MCVCACVHVFECVLVRVLCVSVSVVCGSVSVSVC